MTEIGIAQIRDIIYRGDDLYCSVCFRTAADRNLVKPVHLKSFINKLIDAVDFEETIQVCYVCEALAKTALRFTRAIELASKVTELFNSMNPREWNSIKNTLKTPGCTPRVVNKQNLYHQTYELDKEIRAFVSFELRRTDTLVVASPQPRTLMRRDPVSTQQERVQVPKTPVQAVPAPVPVLAPPVPAPTPQPLSDQMRISVDPALQHVRVVNQETKDIVLHPIVQGLDGNIYVPSLQLQINDGIFKSVPNVQNKLPTPIAPSISPQNLIKLSTVQQTPTTENNEKNKEKTNYHNFLKTQMQEKSKDNVEIIKMNDLNIVLNGGTKQKRRRSEDSMEKTLSEVQLLLNENAQGGCEIKFEIIDDDDGKVTKDIQIGPGKEPVLRTDRTVDWEDKIPMDVISFMDATDPNPEERIMQPPPMGVISDVRTVPDEADECIDLC